jgi:16S rRNA (cytosine967-C5)-methyltransferase
VGEGGTLAYSTCSELVQEDEDVVDAFLASPAGAGFRIASALDAPVTKILPEAARELVRAMTDERGLVRTARSDAGCDGHFLALLERVHK